MSLRTEHQELATEVAFREFVAEPATIQPWVADAEDERVNSTKTVPPSDLHHRVEHQLQRLERLIHHRHQPSSEPQAVDAAHLRTPAWRRRTQGEHHAAVVT